MATITGLDLQVISKYVLILTFEITIFKSTGFRVLFHAVLLFPPSPTDKILQLYLFSYRVRDTLQLCSNHCHTEP